jgi:hypothetical protein
VSASESKFTPAVLVFVLLAIQQPNDTRIQARWRTTNYAAVGMVNRIVRRGGIDISLSSFGASAILASHQCHTSLRLLPSPDLRPPRPCCCRDSSTTRCRDVTLASFYRNHLPALYSRPPCALRCRNLATGRSRHRATARSFCQPALKSGGRGFGSCPVGNCAGANSS